MDATWLRMVVSRLAGRMRWKPPPPDASKSLTAYSAYTYVNQPVCIVMGVLSFGMLMCNQSLAKEGLSLRRVCVIVGGCMFSKALSGNSLSTTIIRGTLRALGALHTWLVALCPPFKFYMPREQTIIFDYIPDHRNCARLMQLD